MKDGIFTYLIGIGVFIFGVYILVSFVPVGLWLRAWVSGVNVSLLDLIYMKIRRVAASPIVKSLILASKAGIEIQPAALEAHSMAGGNVEHVVKRMINAKKSKVQLSFSEACRLDLEQKDSSAEPKGERSVKKSKSKK